MKAVFVIDLPVALENLIGEELLLYINYKDDRYIMTEECKLRPLPQKKDIDKTLEFGGYENIIQESLAIGYNACLEEITK